MNGARQNKILKPSRPTPDTEAGKRNDYATSKEPSIQMEKRRSDTEELQVLLPPIGLGVGEALRKVQALYGVTACVR
jgi:hypothetical protein